MGRKDKRPDATYMSLHFCLKDIGRSKFADILDRAGGILTILPYSIAVTVRRSHYVWPVKQMRLYKQKSKKIKEYEKQ